MKLKVKYDIEVEEHIDNEADKEFIEKFKATSDEDITEKLRTAMEEILSEGGCSGIIKVTVNDWDTDFEV